MAGEGRIGFLVIAALWAAALLALPSGRALGVPATAATAPSPQSQSG